MFWTLKQKTNSKGSRAEQQALHFLLQQGLKLIRQNYACRAGELDLVMLDKHFLVFIEVRLRSSHQYGGAKASVTASKRQRLEKAARHFLQSHPEFQHKFCRFDLVCLTTAKSSNDEPPQKPIEWIKGIFQ